ncbi:MAG: Calx-beta domain-containing protein [Panacagrimonas sp.]
MSTAEWASIQTQIEQSRYRLEADHQAAHGVNPKQGWTLHFSDRGLSLNTAEPNRSVRAEHETPQSDTPAPTTRTTSEALRLRTTAIGRGEALVPVVGAKPVVRGNRAELAHGVATEWYVNSGLGLEHGYTFDAAPDGRGKVRIQIAVEGGLLPMADGDSVLLTDQSNTQRIRYQKLLVLDANQKHLDARMSVTPERRIEIAFDDTHAAYPVVVDPLLVNQEAKLVAADSAKGDFFGYSVAVSGDTAVMGAFQDEVGANFFQGSAYVFVRSGMSWTQQAKLIAADGAALDRFGISVSVSGDTTVVGAYPDNFGGNGNQGSAYVFVRSGTSWTQQAKLVAADGAAGDEFGISVAMSGDTAVVGAHQDEVGANFLQGSAYVFVRNGTSWTQQQKLVAADGAEFDGFGISVALSGDTVVAGADGDNVGANGSQGSAYVFVRSGVSWMQQAKLIAADGAVEDFFGYSVTVSGDTAVVGAYSDEVGANFSQGSAYVFVRSGTIWTQQAKLLAADGAAFQEFGSSVALSGNTAVVGVFRDDIGANSDQGSAYVFVRSGASWTQQAKLIAADGAAGDLFGFSVAASNDTAVVGAHFDKFFGGNNGQDSAYVYRLTADLGPPSLRIRNLSSREGNQGTRNFRFTVNLSAAASSPASVNFATANGSAKSGSDYTPASGVLLFDPGQTSKSVNISVRGDTKVEPDETFFVNLSAPSGATIADGSGKGTITNDDTSPPALSINNVSLSEGSPEQNRNATFAVSLSRVSNKTVTVRYATANATASAPGDYKAINGTLRFAPGETRRTVAVKVKGDGAAEANETFKLNLSNPVNASIADGKGVGTIRNDD